MQTAEIIDQHRRLRAFWLRAEAALSARAISSGAFCLLKHYAERARRSGGDSFEHSERDIERETGRARMTQRAYRLQLQASGLISFQQEWAFRRGWFYLSRLTLLFDASGLKTSPDSGLKCSPSLIRKRVLSPNLSAKRDSLHSGPLRGGKEGKEQSRSLRSTEGNEEMQAASKGSSQDAGLGKRYMGRLRRLLGDEFTNDAGKWGKRCQVDLGKVAYCVCKLEARLSRSKPVASRAAVLETFWKGETLSD